MLVLAIVTGILAGLNYYWQSDESLALPLQIVGLAAQLVLTALTIIAASRFRGRRSRPSYGGGHYRIWTFSFGLIVLSLLGNVCILVAFALHLSGVIDHL